jgi:hypothetical protein
VVEDCESNVLYLKSSLLSFLLDWAIAYVPNYPSSNLVNLDIIRAVVFSCILFMYEGFAFLLINYYS